MIVVRNKLSGLILPGRFPALCIWPFVFIKPETTMTTANILKHEKIHARQQLEMGWIFFFLWYLIEFLIRFTIHRNFMRAYHNLSHEREAYEHDQDAEYLEKRKSYAWVNYLLKK